MVSKRNKKKGEKKKEKKNQSQIKPALLSWNSPQSFAAIISLSVQLVCIQTHTSFLIHTFYVNSLSVKIDV